MALNPCCVAVTKLSFFQTSLKFLDEKPKEVLKTMKYALQWFEIARPSVQLLPPGNEKAINFLGDAKNFLSARELPKAVHKFAMSVFFPKADRKPLEIIKNAGSVASTTYDTVELVSKYVAPVPYAKCFKGANMAGTITNSTIAVVQETTALIKGRISLVSETGAHRLLKIARDVSFAAVGVFGAIMMRAGQTYVSSKMMLTALSSGLVFTVAEFFFANMRAPENTTMRSLTNDQYIRVVRDHQNTDAHVFV